MSVLVIKQFAIGCTKWFESRRPAGCQELTAAHRRARLNSAQEHQHLQLRHSRTVLFTDVYGVPKWNLMPIF